MRGAAPVLLALAVACRGGPADDSGVAPAVESLLLVPGYDGLLFYDADFAPVAAWTWPELVPGCDARCGGLGAAADGDGLLVAAAYGGSGEDRPSGVVRLSADGPEIVAPGPFAFAHNAVRDPVTGAMIVTETSLDQLLWLDDDGATALYTLGVDHPDFVELRPNGLKLLELDSGVHLLLSSRGVVGPGGTPGVISLWNVDDPDAPSLVWRFPGSGSLAAPHGPELREWAGRWWLLYAETGSRNLGVAITDDPTVLPAHVADLTLPDAEEAGFLRAIGLQDDGTLLVVDSGGQNGNPPKGSIYLASLPDELLDARAGDAPRVLELDDAAVVIDELADPFEAWWWAPTFAP